MFRHAKISYYDLISSGVILKAESNILWMWMPKLDLQLVPQKSQSLRINLSIFFNLIQV
jgi:hypothetical protein